MAESPFTLAGNIKTVVIANLSQFVSANGSNFGIGYSGWDAAWKYARNNGLDYFGAVHVITGDANQPQAFGNGMWTWNYLVRLHTKFELATASTDEQHSMDLADDFMQLVFDTTARRAILSTGAISLTAANFVGDPVIVNDVTYLSSEFLLSAKQQI